jgi:hypothetical protein
MVTAYVMAAMLDRDVKIKMTYPCDLDLFLIPNKIDWRTTETFPRRTWWQRLLGLGKEEENFLAYMNWKGLQKMKEELLSKDDLDLLLPAKVTWLELNMEAVQFLREHLLAACEMVEIP